MKTSKSTLTEVRVALRTARDVLPGHTRPKSRKKLVPVRLQRRCPCVLPSTRFGSKEILLLPLQWIMAQL